MQSRIARRLKAGIGTDLKRLCQATGLDFDACPKTVSIGARANGLNAQPMSRFCSLLAKQNRRSVEHRHEQIFSAVIQKITGLYSSCHITLLERRARGQADFAQLSLKIMEE